MNNLLLQLFWALSLIVFHCAFEYEYENFSNRQFYDLNALFTNGLNRLQKSRQLSDHNIHSIANLQVEQDGHLWKKSKCTSDILFTLKNYKTLPSLQMFDSYGKLESGILQGNIRWVGDYDECIQVHSSNPNSTIGNFYGKYCSVSLNLPIQNVTVTFVYGICVPDSCSPTELKDVLQFSHGAGSVPVFSSIQSNSSVTITCKPLEHQLNTPAIAVIVLLSVFLSLALLGSLITAVEYFMQVVYSPKYSSLAVNTSEGDNAIGGIIRHVDEDEYLVHDAVSTNEENVSLGKIQAFLRCFCVFTNGAKLLNTESSEGELLCIHGIRFLSMSWVILGHTYGFGIMETRNVAEAVQLTDSFPFQAVLQGFYAVDSFFVLSGFLLAYLTMKEYDKKGRIPWLYFYIHRFIRLTPIYMIVLAFTATVSFYIGSGPFWPDGDFDPICRDKWWYNLLYINNFLDMTEQCMAWSWYLANDMQFFIISPLFLISLWRWPKVGYVLLAMFLCACWLSNFFITYHYQLIAGFSEIFKNPAGMTEALEKFMLFFDKLYIKPYARISPYLIGILVGYILFRNNKINKPKHGWDFLFVGWIIATSITLACVYGLYHAHPTVLTSSFYNALNRTCFALGLSWVIYVCLRGQGGFVNRILSCKLFIPLGRLTYAAYLIHPIILTAYYASLKATFEFSHPTMVCTYLGVLVATYGLSLPVSLMLEYPVAALEKLVCKAFSKEERN